MEGEIDSNLTCHALAGFAFLMRKTNFKLLERVGVWVKTFRRWKTDKSNQICMNPADKFYDTLYEQKYGKFHCAFRLALYNWKIFAELKTIYTHSIVLHRLKSFSLLVALLNATTRTQNESTSFCWDEPSFVRKILISFAQEFGHEFYHLLFLRHFNSVKMLLFASLSPESSRLVEQMISLS